MMRFIFTIPLIILANFAFTQTEPDSLKIKINTDNIKRLPVIMGDEISPSPGYIVIYEPFTVKGYSIDPFNTHKSTRINIYNSSEVNQNLGEILQNNTSLFFKSYGGGGVSTISFRGTSASHTNVYWNGINLGSPTLGQLDFSSLVSNGGMGEIDIHYGASTLVDGSGSLGGSVQLRNGPDWYTKKYVEIATDAGSFGRLNGSLNVSLKAKKFISQTSVAYRRLNNDFTYQDNTIQGWPIDTQHNALQSNLSFVQQFYIPIRQNKKQYLSVRYLFTDNERQLPKTLISSQKNEELNDNLQTVQLELVNKKQYLKNFVARSAYVRQNSEYNNFSDNIFSKTLSHSAQNNFRYKRAYSSGLVYEIGANADWFIADTENYSELKVQQRAGVFGQIKKRFKKRITASLMLREELNDFTFSPILPSIGLLKEFILSPSNYGGVRANIAQNYRYPTLNDLYWQNSGNPDLNPEIARMAEAGLYFKRDKEKHKFSIDFAGFYSMIDNWIIWLPNGPFWSPQNIKKVNNKGIEIETSAKVFATNDLTINYKTNYSLTVSKTIESDQANDNSVDKQLIFVPQHIINGSLALVYNNFGLSYSQNYNGKFYVSSDNSTYMPAYVIANVELAYTKPIKDKYITKFFLRANNLFNASYQVIPYRPMPGISFIAGAKFIMSKS